MEQLYKAGNYAETYSELPQEQPENQWREGMISGNGENGFVTSSAPYSDSFIFQNMWFNFPSRDPRFIPPELPSQLEAAREAVFGLNDKWDVGQVHADGSVTRRRRTYYYCYHPGTQLRLTMKNRYEERNYIRWTNYETAEVGVKYTDDGGEWTRVSFTSRSDNVSITKITHSSSGTPVNMTVSIDDIRSMHKSFDWMSRLSDMRYKKIAAIESRGDCNSAHIAQVAHYPEYEGSELRRGGYACVTRIITDGGTINMYTSPSDEAINIGDGNPFIEISGANAVYLITKCDRTFDMGSLKDFAAVKEYGIVGKLLDDTALVAGKYRRGICVFDYAAALREHAAIHGKEFNAVSVKFNCGKSDMSNEALLSLQKNNKNTVEPQFLEAVYGQSRYAQICCSGSSAPRLYGMWTGEWQPGWRGIYTLDANVNLQVAPMNTGNLSFAPLGYITFFLRNVPDWMLNAKMSYGIENGLQVSVNSDIDRGMHVEYDNDYPFQYWNAGASWCLLPIFEYWQCRGNMKIPLDERMNIDLLSCALSIDDTPLSQSELDEIKRRGYLDLASEILLPLLTKQANFWEGLCTPEYYTDKNGVACHKKGKSSLEGNEHYLLIPTYSPENCPLGYTSTLTANATMDISAAKDGLDMVIAIEKAVKKPGWESRAAKWERLKQLLPEYKNDESGALREWSMNEYKENNNHRHLSHLYVAWPAYETKKDEKLFIAAKKALDNRNEYNVDDATAGHGWMHKALVEARLGYGDRAMKSILPMMSGMGYYTSLMTDHDTNRRNGCYCTDTLFATAAVVNEMLVFSNTGEIELLPALPCGFDSGKLSGLLTRTRAEIVLLTWDLKAKTVCASVKSFAVQDIKINLGIKYSGVRANGKPIDTDSVHFEAGQTISFEFSIM